MSHHLTPEARERVHREHVEREGGYSSHIVSLPIPLYGVPRPHLSLQEDPLGPPDQEPAAEVSVHFEVCLRCGLISPVGCDHGASIWTHRFNCPSGEAEGLPHGLVTGIHDTDFAGGPPDEECTGCLLLCPVCKNDGT